MYHICQIQNTWLDVFDDTGVLNEYSNYAIIHRSRDLQSATVWDLWDFDEIDEPVKFQLDTKGTC